MSNILALIPARGGSKGIPHKNIRPLAGKPLVAHSIEQALRSPSVTRVVVSTDDPDIAEKSRRHGAEIVLRPAEISGDEATSESALRHVLDHLRDAEGYEPDLVVFLQATSPLRPDGAIQEAIETIAREGADSLFSACPVHGFVWRIERGRPESFTYDYRQRRRRQDSSEDLLENGSIYVFKPWVLREHDNRLGGVITVYRMDVLDSFQVDEPSDFVLMEALLAARRPRSASGLDLEHVRLLVLDFDGVMTDNRVLVDQDGKESVYCHRGDGWGLARLCETGLKVVILSTEVNNVVHARAAKLGLDCINACDDKLSALRDLCDRMGVSRQEVAYVGNDENDLACMKWVGLPIAVADAESVVQDVARWVTRRAGGLGAVREIADVLIRQRS